MTTIKTWRVRCTTDNTWESVDQAVEPTICPINAGHTINANLTSCVYKPIDIRDLPIEVQANAKEFPLEHFYGRSMFDYTGTGVVDRNEVQYSRVWLSSGLVIDRLQVFVDSGGTAARHLRVGIYDQADPENISGTPNAKLAESAEGDTNVADGSYLPLNLGSVLTIATTGYYWLAVAFDSPAINLAISGSVPANFLPVRREATTDTTLPATVGTLTNPSSPVIYVAALEQ